METNTTTETGAVETETGAGAPPLPHRVRVQRVTNPCCCDCALTSAAFYIIALELIWGIIGGVCTLSLLVTVQRSKEAVDSATGLIKPQEIEDAKYFEDHKATLLGTLALFCAGLVVSTVLCMAVSRRFISACYIWIFLIMAVAVGHLVMLAMDQYSVTYSTAWFILPRAYFMFVIHCFAMEVKAYPNGAPMAFQDTVIMDPVGYGGRPTATYAYPPAVGYGYPGYGYPGYGYGYGGDAAVAGLAVGMAMGGGFGYGGCYDGGFYDDCYF